MADQWVVHGGAISHARACFPNAPEPWLDLSTGINPVPWLVGDVAGPDWTRLPEPDALAGLEAAAARYFGVEPEHLCATPGSELGLRLLADAGAPAPFSCLWPAYRTHLEGLPDCRAAALEDLDRLARRPGTLVLANPNNPDGRLLGVDTLLEVAKHKQRAGGWLVVDEAFIDAHEGESLAPRLWSTGRPDLPVALLRSFGKFFGLPGLRLGFLIGPRGLVQRMRALLGSWPVNAAAISIGHAAYADEVWHAATRARLSEDCAALDDLLARHGLSPRGDCPLFRLVEAEEHEGGSATLFEHLARQGILTRPFSYDPRWLRIGLPATGAQRARLDAALAGWRT